MDWSDLVPACGAYDFATGYAIMMVVAFHMEGEALAGAGRLRIARDCVRVLRNGSDQYAAVASSSYGRGGYTEADSRESREVRRESMSYSTKRALAPIKMIYRLRGGFRKSERAFLAESIERLFEDLDAALSRISQEDPDGSTLP